MRRKDCIVDCVGPDCEGCRNYKTRQMKDEIKDKIIEIQDELIEHIKSNGMDSPFRSDELKYIRLFNSLATLKSQLSEAGEENKSSHELQNERMRIWFQKRTGLIDAMLCTHMKKIDEMLSIDPVE